MKTLLLSILLLLSSCNFPTSSSRNHASAAFSSSTSSSSISSKSSSLSSSSKSFFSITAKEPQPSIGEAMADIGFYQSIQVTSDTPLVEAQSSFQKIQIFESHHFGKILVLDGVVQLTEKDANAYNEMMAHLPLFQHVNPKRVLVIGGGDGFILKEVLKHPSVVSVDHVDLDEEVIRVCQEHFFTADDPQEQDPWKDPRVKLHIADGADFVNRASSNYYDVIIQDSSDPWTWDEEGHPIDLPSMTLYEVSHLQNLHRILKPNGVLALQAESIQIPSDLQDIVEWRRDTLQVGFASVRYASITINSYPTGQIGCFISEKKPLSENLAGVVERYQGMLSRGHETSYYHPRLQVSAFDLPLWAEKAIYGGDYMNQLDSNQKKTTKNRGSVTSGSIFETVVSTLSRSIMTAE